MNWLALLLHAGLGLAAAPALESLMRRAGASWRGEAPPPVAQPWRDLVRLWRKTASVPTGASFVLAAGPVGAAACAVAAFLLVPSFTLGMAQAAGSDLVVVVGLLAASRAALALAAHDSGWAVQAQAGASAMAARLGAAPVLLVVAMALVLLSGGTNLDAAAAAVRDGGAGAHAVGLLAGAALLGVMAAERDVPFHLPGRLGALDQAAAQLRLVTGLALAAAVALPFGTAPAGSGALAWLAGAACWALKLGVLALLAAALRGWRLVLPAAALLALVAVAVASVQGRA